MLLLYKVIPTMILVTNGHGTTKHQQTFQVTGEAGMNIIMIQ